MNTLNKDEINQFHEKGYLGPYDLCTPEQMSIVRERIETDLLGTPTVHGMAQYQTRHLDNRTVYDICVAPAILDRVACLYGPDLVLWQSNFFMKEPGGKEIPWHQDRNYWPIEPVLNISAWVAIDKVDSENSCVKLIPASHRKSFPEIPTEEHQAFSQRADPEFVDTTDMVEMALEAGQFFLFSERLLHQSDVNRSDRRRMGLAVRLTVPLVRCWHDHPMVIVRGEDRLNFNEVTEPPAQDTPPPWAEN
ncbi:MAG: phytanoyl-CoA dioxygenase family protein [Lentisphaeria bacterium]|nr:phytanoyl-CoA dioxygenase family protein [Lentisphaeria bacterium]NQZ68682.1 phytanoyl-CoA dioxygenase family protein [Lentisphaeria bacterium]